MTTGAGPHTQPELRREVARERLRRVHEQVGARDGDEPAEDEGQGSAFVTAGLCVGRAGIMLAA